MFYYFCDGLSSCQALEGAKKLDWGPFFYFIYNLLHVQPSINVLQKFRFIWLSILRFSVLGIYYWLHTYYFAHNGEHKRAPLLMCSLKPTRGLNYPRITRCRWYRGDGTISNTTCGSDPVCSWSIRLPPSGWLGKLQLRNISSWRRSLNGEEKKVGNSLSL